MKAIPIEHKRKEITPTLPPSRDDQQIQKTCFQLMHYVADNSDAGLEETRKLLDNMERSMLCLQRKKQKMVEKISRKGHK